MKKASVIEARRTAKAKRLARRANPNQLDPLLYEAEFPFTGTYYPLGFTVQIATNSRDVLLGAEESWQRFNKRFSEPPFHFRIGVVNGKSKQCPRPPSVRGYRDLVARVADAQNFIVSNADCAFGWLTQAAASHRPYLRYFFLEGTFWTLAVPRYLTPIHAACVSHRGSGVLLCGDSGAGKSLLSYACARAGWSFLCDDSTHLVRGRAGRVVIGNPYQIRFRPSAMELFPELRYQRVNPHITGKLSIELVTSSFSEIKLDLEAHVDFIVFLNRQPGGARLIHRSKESVKGWFHRVLSASNPAIREAQRAALENLFTAEIFELRYSDFDSAIDQLESMVQSAGSRLPALALAGGISRNG